MSKKVYVGMSGGVDSSVTAALMVERGYDVTGVYMKNWSKDLPGLPCPWKEDYQDAKRVAVQLGIEFVLFDFESAYRDLVVNYMLDGYKDGITPNPDVMCNQEIKFKLFLDTARDAGADFIATGHYSRIKNGTLWQGVDNNKDQSYFLYRVSKTAFEHSLMPIGEMTKDKVRDLARKRRLVTADKKDSQGICFVGKVGIKDFLLAELGAQPPGSIIDQTGKIVGRHDGALFYTIGQRHGLRVGGSLPFYVTGKDMKRNVVYVTTDLQDPELWKKSLQLTSVHWIDKLPAKTDKLTVRTRYRAPLVEVSAHKQLKNTDWSIQLSEEIRAATPGQSAVIYRGEQVLGGGLVV